MKKTLDIKKLILLIALTYLCVAQNLNLPLFLTIQCFFITGIRQEQAGSFAFPANRGIVRQHIKNNHVPGVLRKTLEVHISMTVIILRSCLCPHFFHQLPYGLSLRHHACSFLPAVPGNKKATIYQPPYRS